MPSMTFMPVDNGDMVLTELESNRCILTDINIREVKEGVRDVAADLRSRLPVDAKGRPYVDVFLLTHPDQDHCRGLAKHFHLGPLSEYRDPPKGEPKKIIICEMWSSPMVFRRASKLHPLCEDAKAWNAEARRRVAVFRSGQAVGDGDRIIVLGEDEDGKTEDLTGILVKVNQAFNRVNGNTDSTINVRLLAPMPKGDEVMEDIRSKNHSSVIVQMAIKAEGEPEACLFLTGGDAGVAIWERLWADHGKDPKWLRYDVLLTPHHCSWRSLSRDSWSDYGEDAELSQAARNALAQAQPGAYLIASSKVITDKDSDPPCVRAEREYKAIARKAGGQFKNTALEPSKVNPEPYELEIKRGGVRPKRARADAAAAAAIGTTPVYHG